MTSQISGGTEAKNDKSDDFTDEGGGYWYGNHVEAASSIDLLNLLRQYREAEKRMRIRTRELMRMGETDMAALRFLIRERGAGRLARQKDLASALQLTGASTSVLVDRLSRAGHLLRVPHPEDRRSVVLEIPAGTHQEIKATLGGMHDRMLEVTDALTEQERACAAKFLHGLMASVSDPELRNDRPLGGRGEH